MRIGLLTTSYPRHDADHAGRFVAELAGGLAAAGDRVALLAPRGARERRPGIALWEVPGGRGLLHGAGAPEALLSGGRAARARAWAAAPGFSARLALETARRAGGWQRILSHWLLPCGVAAALGGGRRPHLAIAHGSDVHLLRRLPGAARLLGLVARGPSRLALSCEALRAPLAEAAAGSRAARRLVRGAVVVRMGVPEAPAAGFDEARAARAALGLDGRPVVAFIGRLVPLKGAALLAAACAPLDVQLLVAGEGPEAAAVARAAAGGRAVLRLLGPVAGEGKRRLLAAADVVAVPSLPLPDGRFDAAPVVPLEAMMAARPVVASATGGLPELVADGVDGLLVPPGDAAALRRAIATLLADPRGRRRLADRGRGTARLHAWPRVVARVRHLLATLDDAPAPGGGRRYAGAGRPRR